MRLARPKTRYPLFVSCQSPLSGSSCVEVNGVENSSASKRASSVATMGERFDAMRIDYAVRSHERWYTGDGLYGDGPRFHWDYYNSFVIQPMLVDVLEAVGGERPEWLGMRPAVLARAKRYAAILERLIAPDGTFPPIGRSNWAR